MNVSERSAEPRAPASVAAFAPAMMDAPQPETAEPVGAEATCADARFRTLVGAAAWATLPPQVKRRFSKRLLPGEMVVYRGTVTATELSRGGRMLAFLARAIGAPLPLKNGATGPAVVLVSEDLSLGKQSWTRIYTRPGRGPQTIHSCKRFRGPTGLEEYVGFGVGMALAVAVVDATLVFRSDHYFLALGRWRWRLPKMLEPGRMEITHRDEAPGMFSFRLRLAHPLIGGLVHQLAYFHDA